MASSNANIVIAYDINGNEINRFSSMTKALHFANITSYKMKKAILMKESINDILYTSDDYIKNQTEFIKLKCNYCGKDVYLSNNQINKSKNNYCSRECAAKAMKSKELNCTCTMCGKKFHLKKYELNRYEHHCCSRDCYLKWLSQRMLGENNHQYGLKGNKNASWKSDEKITTYGYKKIRALNHPFKDSDDMVFEHRLVAEKYLLTSENSVEINGNSYLKKELEVHHIDKNRLNNNVDNLVVLTKSEHRRLHMKERGGVK